MTLSQGRVQEFFIGGKIEGPKAESGVGFLWKGQQPSDVNKDWTCKDKDKDKDKDLTHKAQDKDKDLNLVLKDKDRDKDFTYRYLLQVAAKSTIAIKQQQWTQSESSQHMTVKPITLNK